MAGNANSGRKPGALTNAQMKVRSDTISSCWDLIKECIADVTLDKKGRGDLAAKIAAKSMPQEMTGDIGVHLQAMGTISYGGQEAVFKIGSPADADNPPEDTEPTA